MFSYSSTIITSHYNVKIFYLYILILTYLIRNFKYSINIDIKSDYNLAKKKWVLVLILKINSQSFIGTFNVSEDLWIPFKVFAINDNLVRDSNLNHRPGGTMINK